MKQMMTMNLKQAISNVLEMMFFVPVQIVEEMPPLGVKPFRGEACIGATLAFSGPLSGYYYLMIPQEMAREITANFLGLDEDEVSGDQEEIMELSSETPTDSPVELRSYPMQQANISPTGAGLLTSVNDVPRMQVGLLLLLHYEHRREWRLGVVRRLLQREESVVEIGVQFVQGAVETAMIRPVIPDTEERADLQPALLLYRGGDKGDAIFTPHMIYKPAREYTLIKDSGETRRILSDKLLESTGTFQRFEYHLANIHGELADPSTHSPSSTG